MLHVSHSAHGIMQDLIKKWCGVLESELIRRCQFV